MTDGIIECAGEEKMCISSNYIQDAFNRQTDRQSVGSYSIGNDCDGLFRLPILLGHFCVFVARRQTHVLFLAPPSQSSRGLCVRQCLEALSVSYVSELVLPSPQRYQ